MDCGIRHELEDQVNPLTDSTHADVRLHDALNELDQTRRMLDDQQRLVSLGSWERDMETGETHWSDELFRIHGFEPGAFIPDGNSSGRLTVPEDQEKRDAWRAAMASANGEAVAEILRIQRPSGERRTVRTRAMVITDPVTKHRRVIGTVQDITDEMRARDAELLLSQVVRSASQAIFTITPERIITSWNPACERLYGYTAEEMLGDTLHRLLPEDVSATDTATTEVRNDRLLTGEVESEIYETRRRRKDGTLVDVEVTWSALRDADGAIVGTVASVTDMSEHTRDAARVSYLSTHDPLTGLLNRRGFEEVLEYVVTDDESGALVMLDLDNFKYVNETYGHKTGDALVAELALKLSACLEEDAVLARLGGDEFCVLKKVEELDEARAIADILLESVRNHVMCVDDVPIRTSASIGVTGFRAGTSQAAELLADADRAMYASKEAGRDRVTVFTESERKLARRSMQTAGEHMIRSALAEDRFELYAHPIVNLATGIMSHCEVLLRMRSETGELVSPGEFLPTAERLGLIHLIDYWVIEHALAEAVKHPDLIFEINLSGATIDDSGLEAFIEHHLHLNELDPNRIVFELTETAAVGNLPRARELASHLSELGCLFAIDDFGAGFSTFYYLKHFPAKYVKIDGEFMNDAHSRMDELVIESIVRIGREVGKLTIAEYVSDYAAMERARELGVDYGQGYYFSKPFPISELPNKPRKLLDVDDHAGDRPLYARHS